MKQYAKQNNCSYRLVSAKTNSNVLESFVTIVKTLLEKQ